MMKKPWFYHSTLLLLLFSFSCQPQQQSGDTPTEKDNSFEEFYDNFHKDSLYQIEHIQFPLQGVSSNPTDHHSAFRWEREDWRMHKRFNEAESGFRSEFTQLGDDFIIERIVHNQGLYAMERRFSKLGGDEWYLIYYAALHPL